MNAKAKNVKKTLNDRSLKAADKKVKLLAYLYSMERALIPRCDLESLGFDDEVIEAINELFTEEERRKATEIVEKREQNGDS